MEITEARSGIKPPAMIAGPSVTLVNRDIRQETREDEKGTIAEYVYTQYRFDEGEYESVRAGILPEGAAWDAELRRIERSAKLDEADMGIAEAEDNIATGSEGGAYLQALREYKMAVRATIEQSGYPSVVEYPEIPANPF